jgi:class 3 adenylate cyclase
MAIDRIGRRENIAENRNAETCKRIAVISYLFAAGFCIYGISSFEVFNKFVPGLTLWGNVWPRILFNSIPFLILASFVKSNLLSAQLRCGLALVLTPLIFAAACMIYAWPAMWHGKTELYGYLHGANIFVITMTCIYISPPIRYLILLLASFMLFFATPVALILLKNSHYAVLYMFLGDVSIFFPSMFLLASQVSKLRENLEVRRLDLEEKVTPFLGGYLSKAIHQNKPEMLQDKILCGIIMNMDIRGYSTITQSLSSEQLNDFIKIYQNKLVNALNRSQGYLHKSMGDGHLISFGLFDVPSLVDIPALKDVQEESEERRIITYTQAALKFHEIISQDLEKILISYGLMSGYGIGLATSLIYGDVRISLIGDTQHRLEFDIGGVNINRATRMQEYSKVIRAMSDAYTRHFNSIIVIGSELDECLRQLGVQAQQISTTGDKSVRDFPAVEKVYFIANLADARDLTFSA